MAKNWMAYEAAEVLLKGTDKTAVAEIGSRYPLFTVAVLHDGTEALLDILKAVAKTTARVVETGLKDAEDVETEAVETEEEVKEEKPAKNKKAETEDDDEPLTDDYEDMTSAQLYKEVCKRGLSSKVKDRKKSTLIAMLKADDAGEVEEDTEEAEDDGWDEEEETDPYAGKTAKELYKMCMDRKIKAQPKKKADFYADLLKKADEKAAKAKTKTKEPEPEEEDEDDDDWEI